MTFWLNINIYRRPGVTVSVTIQCFPAVGAKDCLKEYAAVRQRNSVN